MAINASGGISSAEDAYRALEAGADTVQLFTALVYEGPGVVANINRGLLRLLEESGVPSVAHLTRPTNAPRPAETPASPLTEATTRS
jgi:dihydroorotate dehydrogenase